MSVNFSSVTDSVDDDQLLALHNLKDDSVRTFSDLVESFQFPFECEELRRIEVF